MRDIRLFYPEVQFGGRVVGVDEDVPCLNLGDALRRRCEEIVARPSRVDSRPARDRGLDPVWREVRRHHHGEFGFKASPRLPHDRRNRVALSYGIAEVVAEALYAPVYSFLLAFDDRVGNVARLSAPADRDPWAPRR